MNSDYSRNTFFNHFSTKMVKEALYYVLDNVNEAELNKQLNKIPKDAERHTIVSKATSIFNKFAMGLNEEKAESIHCVIEFLNNTHSGYENIVEPIPEEYMEAMGDIVLYLAKKNEKEFSTLVDVAQTTPCENRKWSLFKIGCEDESRPPDKDIIPLETLDELRNVLKEEYRTKQRDGSGINGIDFSSYVVDGNVEYHFWHISMPASNVRIMEGDEVTQKLLVQPKDTVIVYYRNTQKAYISSPRSKNRRPFLELWAKHIKGCKVIDNTLYGHRYNIDQFFDSPQIDATMIPDKYGVVSARIAEQIVHVEGYGKLQFTPDTGVSLKRFIEDLIKKPNIDEKFYEIKKTRIAFKFNKNVFGGKSTSQSLEITPDSTNIESKRTSVKPVLKQLLKVLNISNEDADNDENV